MENKDESKKSNAQGKIFSFPEKWRKYFRWAIGGFFLWLFVRTFMFQVVYVPSASMNNTLREGDYILINKLAYGPRLPMTIFSIPFSSSIYLDWVELSYHRIPGYSDVKRGDVIVFNLPSEDDLPIDVRQQYVKRCVALPGDTFSIVDGNVEIGGLKFVSENWGLPCPPGRKMKYAVQMKNAVDHLNDFLKLGIDSPSVSTDKIHYNLLLTTDEKNALLKSGIADSVNRVSIDRNAYVYAMFPQNGNFRWNMDNFGPVVIPEKGKSVTITNKNLPLYKKIIVNYEENTIFIRNDSVYINNKFSPTYTFKENYYFMMGDNRYDSNDSRYWGFVPESHIIGKAAYILFSSGKTSPGPSRSFSAIK